jgi:hypothetical protein
VDELLAAGGGVLVGDDPASAARAVAALGREPITAEAVAAGARYSWSAMADGVLAAATGLLDPRRTDAQRLLVR